LFITSIKIGRLQDRTGRGERRKPTDACLCMVWAESGGEQPGFQHPESVETAPKEKKKKKISSSSLLMRGKEGKKCPPPLLLRAGSGVVFRQRKGKGKRGGDPRGNLSVKRGGRGEKKGMRAVSSARTGLNLAEKKKEEKKRERPFLDCCVEP